MKKALHTGHRKRMKERCRSTNIDSLQDHEVIELLLFYAIPYKNTNETAHFLLNKFGSVSGVLDASFEELIKFKGIGEHTATLITTLPRLFRRYEMDKKKGERTYTHDMIGEYCLNHFIGATAEHVELLLFDAKMHMTGHVTVHDGALSASSVNAEMLGNYIFGGNACSYVLAHNHPSGNIEPSGEDLHVTREIHNAFKPLNKHMAEHFIIADGRYKPILDEALDMYDK